MEFEKPLPLQTPASQPYWEGLKNRKVCIQQCDDCATWIFYPRNHCTACLGNSLSWKDVSGEATLYSYTIARQPTAPHFADEVPQLLAIVELDQGVRMTSTLVDANPDDLQVGMRLLPHFDRMSDDVTLLRFAPVLARGKLTSAAD